MYQVLVYVYENYGGGADTPDRQRLGMRLSSAGFERDEIPVSSTHLTRPTICSVENSVVARGVNNREVSRRS